MGKGNGVGMKPETAGVRDCGLEQSLMRDAVLVSAFSSRCTGLNSAAALWGGQQGSDWPDRASRGAALACPWTGDQCTECAEMRKSRSTRATGCTQIDLMCVILGHLNNRWLFKILLSVTVALTGLCSEHQWKQLVNHKSFCLAV